MNRLNWNSRSINVGSDDQVYARFMSRHSCRWPQLLLLGTLATWAATAPGAEKTQFSSQYGGYRVSTDFTVDGKDHAVISPPAGARPGDLLSIRPLRLNNDEYLILQRCKSPACTEPQVVRAWNASGHMGPDPVTSNKIPIARNTTYMLWMQRISTQGGKSFSLYERNSPALVFIPAGSAEIFQASDLADAGKRGPTPVDKSSKESGAFIAKFEGGSVVRMKLLRASTNNDAAAALQ
jgi:hypothetical protein